MAVDDIFITIENDIHTTSFKIIVDVIYVLNCIVLVVAVLICIFSNGCMMEKKITNPSVSFNMLMSPQSFIMKGRIADKIQRNRNFGSYLGVACMTHVFQSIFHPETGQVIM